MLDARTSAAIAGAIELFLGRSDGLKRFDLSVGGFWHSFTAALFALPLFVLIIAGDWTVLVEIGNPPQLSSLIAARAADYTLDFLALPLALALLARRLAITRTYVSYIVARNWATLVIFTPQALVGLAMRFGWISFEVSALASLVIFAVMVVYHYRIARWTLGPQIAAGLVAADLILSLILISFVNRLFGL